MLTWFNSLFGDKSRKFVKGHQATLAQINALEPATRALSDEQLLARTAELRQRLVAGAKLDDLLPEAFAAVREAGVRALGLRMFDVQMMGGLALHYGNIAEMKTGEGKTFVATLPAYLNALTGRGVHIVTVNDYLARRDSQWMGQVFARLGLTTASIHHDLDATQRIAAYRADITYATNNELGFDYLRDHMAMSPQQLVQRPLNYAIIDEVDSILIDEARTPLIISGPTEDKTELYQKIDAFIPNLKEEVHYDIDAKQRTAHFTDAGLDAAEVFLKETGLLPAESNLFDVHNIALVHHLNQALRAHALFHRDIEYIVKDNEVVLIDEFTGRMMTGRRLSDGLHQAIEAKEGVDIKPENVTMASITFQNYFRLYPKLAGMTGTAATEEEEFESIYTLSVIVIPTNVGVNRRDEADIIYRTRAGKLKAIAADIEDCHKRGQPVLVGTISIERSEELSNLLKQKGVPHAVLNARYHEQEAEIIAQAGRKGAVTIATNMAGRGTDIKLGGSLELLLKDAGRPEAQIRKAYEAEHAAVMAAGGLRVLGTERHESRRIDNQLRGRSGRQGDVGSSVFYISLQDDLIKRFAPNLDSLMAKLNMPEDEAIQHPWIAKSIATAQRKIEALNFDLRKHVLKFDDVLNDQRKVIYDQRQHLLHATDLSEDIHEFRREVANELVLQAFPPESLPEQWQPEVLKDGLRRYFGIDAKVEAWLADTDVGAEHIAQRVGDIVAHAWNQKLSEFPPDIMRHIERSVLLQTLDRLWRQHLQSLEFLRRGINWRGFAQKDPINEFARESYMLFEDLLAQIRRDTVALLSRVQLVVEEDMAPGSTLAPQIVSAPDAKPLPITKPAAKTPAKAKAKPAVKTQPAPKTKPAAKAKPKAKPAQAAKKPAKAKNQKNKSKPKRKSR
jgi:preprotein translocase subunit SecA